MFFHHKESIGNMITHYRENTDIKALILIGSVALETARSDSDIDAVAVVPQECYDRKKADCGLEETYYGKCTYDGGYFNLHYMTRDDLETAAFSGSEPVRNMFSKARVLYSDDESLDDIIQRIPVFQRQEAADRQFRFYCTMRMFYNYHWMSCKPKGYAKLHVANAIIFYLYRLILIENEILFPSARKLEEYVVNAPNKPENIVQKCMRFMKWLANDECGELIKSYEAWTSYNYPNEHKVVMNNFINPYELI